MKRFVLLITLVAALGLVSCTAQSSKENAKTDTDSLTNTVGKSQLDNLKDYLVGLLPNAALVCEMELLKVL
jgi:hypothetical protein